MTRALTFYESATAPPGSARPGCTVGRGCCPWVYEGQGSERDPGTPPAAPGEWPGPAYCATGCTACPENEDSTA